MQHPYKSLPDTSFWRRSVVGTSPEQFDPIVSSTLAIAKSDVVATAGSCFAQHIARALREDGFNFLVAESPSREEQAAGVQAIYSARYGNIYTTRQLRQLFEWAYGLTSPEPEPWTRGDGRLVDRLRPNEFAAGFETVESLLAAREAHREAVREVFETCGVFVFTLGLTECWICDQDGVAVPLAPNVVASPGEGRTYSFHNLRVAEMVEDMEVFLSGLTDVNPDVKVILTVSPVPLEATFEPRHVLVSTTASKAALRVVADELASAHPDRVTYFPSYEMITAFPGGFFFEPDLRTVRPDAVGHVMEVFKAHLTETSTAGPLLNRASAAPIVHRVQAALAAPARPAGGRDFTVHCDEEMFGRF